MNDVLEDAENTSEFRIKIFQTEQNELKLLFCLFNTLRSQLYGKIF